MKATVRLLHKSCNCKKIYITANETNIKPHELSDIKNSAESDDFIFFSSERQSTFEYISILRDSVFDTIIVPKI